MVLKSIYYNKKQYIITSNVKSLQITFHTLLSLLFTFNSQELRDILVHPF